MGKLVILYAKQVSVSVFSVFLKNLLLFMKLKRITFTTETKKNPSIVSFQYNSVSLWIKPWTPFNSSTDKPKEFLLMVVFDEENQALMT